MGPAIAHLCVGCSTTRAVRNFPDGPVFLYESMKTILVSGLLAAGAILVGGCGHSKEPAPPGQSEALGGAEQKTLKPPSADLPEAATPQPAAPDRPEQKQVQTVEHSESDFTNLVNQWTQEGWQINAYSKRATNADGTMHRLVLLTKRKP